MSGREVKKRRRLLYSSISIPTPLLNEVEKVVKAFKYWPTKTAFIREACLEKLEKYRRSWRLDEHARVRLDDGANQNLSTRA